MNSFSNDVKPNPDFKDASESCRVCGNARDNRSFTAREMMFGLRDEFSYFECGECGCLQIARIPDDMTAYYPSNYYAYTAAEPPGILKTYLKRLRAAHTLGRPSALGAWLVKRYGVPKGASWARRAGADFDSAILDVGCGQGALLRDLAVCGFTRLSGVDPFIARDIVIGNGSVIRKCSIEEIDGSYDLVMLHHSYEHMPDPAGTLRSVRRLLSKHGTALIRIPVAGTFAWREYGADWVQLDAPRHFFLHTEKSMRRLASDAGLTVVDVEYDSTSFQFWGSEQYRRDIALRDPLSYAESPERSSFDTDTIAAWERRARELNAAGDGDQAAFYLRAR